MKLIKNKEFLRNIAQQIDLFNTIGGGIAETIYHVDKYKKGTIIRVDAPGLSPDRFRIILQKNELTVMTVFVNEENPQLQVPLFHKKFELPAKVNQSKIKASFDDGELQIKLPYYQQGPRTIEIE